MNETEIIFTFKKLYHPYQCEPNLLLGWPMVRDVIILHVFCHLSVLIWTLTRINTCKLHWMQKFTLGIWGCEKSLSTMTPLTSMVSSSCPPTLVSTLINSKLTSRVSMSATDITALTAISAICRWHLFTILEPSVVIAVWIRGSRFFGSSGKDSALFSRFWIAHRAAISKPSAIRMGWIPLSNRFSAFSRSAPARTKRQKSYINWMSVLSLLFADKQQTNKCA